MKINVRSALAGLSALLALSLTAPAVGHESGPEPAADAGPKFKDTNLDRVRQFLAETSVPGRALDDYYFGSAEKAPNFP